jgi:hypothetical protein
MFISVVEQGLEKMIREGLHLSEEVGDVTFESPTTNWSAQLSRVTINLFLYDLTRSANPVRSLTRRTEDSGAKMRRAAQPMVQLSYLVSAWAGSIKDEHMLLGDLVSRLVGIDILPHEMLPQEVSSSVSLSFGGDDRNKNREIWSGLGGHLKASFTLHVDVAADTFDWIQEAPAVERVEALAAPVPWESADGANGTRAIDRSPIRR